MDNAWDDHELRLIPAAAAKGQAVANEALSMALDADMEALKRQVETLEENQQFFEDREDICRLRKTLAGIEWEWRHRRGDDDGTRQNGGGCDMDKARDKDSMLELESIQTLKLIRSAHFHSTALQEQAAAP